MIIGTPSPSHRGGDSPLNQSSFIDVEFLNDHEDESGSQILYNDPFNDDNAEVEYASDDDS